MGADPDNAAGGKLPGSSPVNVPTRHGPPRQKGPSSKRGCAKPTATMADGSGLLIYGYIQLPCRIRTVQVNVLFKVANITDDAILGVQFFDKEQCTLFVHKGLLAIQDQLLTCASRNGELLLNKVQTASTITVPPGTEAQIV